MQTAPTESNAVQPPEPLSISKTIAFLGIVVLGASLAIYYLVFSFRPLSASNKHLDYFHHSSVQKTVAKVDNEFSQQWQQNGIQPAPQADWKLQARRVSLALCGTPPSLEHLRWLEKFDENDRIAKYTSHLLSTKASADYLAERLTRTWLGTQEGSLIVYRGRRFRFWLANQIKKNRPYNKIVQDIFTANGSWTLNPAVNFYTAQSDQDQDNRIDTTRLTGRVSRNFMAMRLDCLQCHDDFMGTTRVGAEIDNLEGTQVDFHQIAAFFAKTRVDLLGVRETKSAEEYQYQLLGDEGPSEIQPKFPFPISDQDSKPGPEEVASRRQHFAKWLTSPNNRPFARAIVNRTWGLIFGKPLHDPVDEIPLYGPFPPGLETLTDDFIDSHFDWHRLISTIIQTRAFSLDSRSENELTQEHRTHWASFPITKIRPEQMAGSVYQSATLTRTDESSSTLTQLVRFGEQSDFLKRFGDLGDEEFGPGNQTVSQRLLLFNGKMIRTRLDAVDAPFGSFQTIAGLAKDRETLIKTIFLLILTRDPNQQELDHFKKSLPEKSSEAAEDLAWVLTNCNESLWNH